MSDLRPECAPWRTSDEHRRTSGTALTDLKLRVEGSSGVTGWSGTAYYVVAQYCPAGPMLDGHVWYNCRRLQRSLIKRHEPQTTASSEVPWRRASVSLNREYSIGRVA